MASYIDMYKPNLVKVTDPIIDQNPILTYPIIQGGVETTLRRFAANSRSQTTLDFNVPPPSPQTFVSRRFLIRVPIKVTLSATTNDASIRPFRIGFDGFKQLPLATMMKTLKISLNGQSVNMEMEKVIKPLLLYHNNWRDLGDREMSMSPQMRDQAQTYDSLVAAAGDATYNRNPLNGYQDSMDRAQIPRGAFNYDNIVSSYDGDTGVATDVIYATLTEELLMSPLVFGGAEDSGFIGLQKVDVNISWISDLTRVWAHAANGSTPAGFSVDSVSVSADDLDEAYIFFRYSSPPLTYEIQPFYQYNYNEIDYQVKTIGSVASYAAGATASATLANINNLALSTVISDNLQINNIPRFLYMFIRQQDPSNVQPDAYAAIDNIKISWNNQNALLSDASQQQLYDISRKNGVDMSWNEWSGYPVCKNFDGAGSFVAGIGSVLCLEFGTDIALKENECPGLIGTYNLQVTVQYRNYAGVTRNNMEFCLLMITPGMFTIYQNSASTRIGILNTEDALLAKEVAGIDYYDLHKNLMSGGMKLKRVKKGLKKIGKLTKRAAPLARQIVPKNYHGLIDAAESLASMGLGGRGGLYVGGVKRRRKGKKPGPKKKKKVGRPKKNKK